MTRIPPAACVKRTGRGIDVSLSGLDSPAVSEEERKTDSTIYVNFITP